MESWFPDPKDEVTIIFEYWDRWHEVFPHKSKDAKACQSELQEIDDDDDSLLDSTPTSTPIDLSSDDQLDLEEAGNNNSIDSSETSLPSVKTILAHGELSQKEKASAPVPPILKPATGSVIISMEEKIGKNKVCKILLNNFLKKLY